MDPSRLLKACGVLVVAAWPAGAAVSAADILARMNAAAASFHQMSADVQRTTHTAVLNEDSVESGSLRMRRLPSGEIQGLVSLTKPDQKYYAFAKRKLQIYTPKINTVQEFDLGSNGEQLDRFLSIGFGSSGKDLADNYEVQVLTDNKVAGTTRLKLVPRNKDVKQYLTRIDLWITDGNYPIQEKLWEPSGDTILVNYSNVHINPNMTASAFELHTAPNPKMEYPQR